MAEKVLGFREWSLHSDPASQKPLPRLRGMQKETSIGNSFATVFGLGSHWKVSWQEAGEKQGRDQVARLSEEAALPAQCEEASGNPAVQFLGTDNQEHQGSSWWAKAQTNYI